MSGKQKNNALLFITLCAVIIFVSTLFNATIYTAGDEVDTGIPPASYTTEGRSHTDASAPERLRIPKINLNAAVQAVGLGKTGNMAVPSNYSDVGWYRYGTLPGEIGSAVIDGHVDNGFGLAGVFAQLDELKVEDDIYVDDKNGEAIHFVVESTASYAVADVPRELLFNRSDASRLNLITCEGEWLSDAQMYDRRHVVYAKRVE